MKMNNKLYFALDLAINILVIIGLAFFIRTYIVSPFHVYGPSMCDTLNLIKGKCEHKYGEYIIVNELVYQSFFGKRISGPKAGDVIIFKPPKNADQYYVKRIIGVPGDKIKIEGGYVYKSFNDEYEKLDESSYLNENNLGHTTIARNEDFVEYTVPPGHYFVLGDNRNESTDSRQCFKTSYSSDCQIGSIDAFVPIENIRGKSWIVFWPPKGIRFMPRVNYE